MIPFVFFILCGRSSVLGALSSDLEQRSKDRSSKRAHHGAPLPLVSGDNMHNIAVLSRSRMPAKERDEWCSGDVTSGRSEVLTSTPCRCDREHFGINAQHPLSRTPGSIPRHANMPPQKPQAPFCLAHNAQRKYTPTWASPMCTACYIYGSRVLVSAWLYQSCFLRHWPAVLLVIIF